LNVGKKRAAFK
jgi:hypothetical protein